MVSSMVLMPSGGASNSDGTLFSFNPNTNALNKLVDFSGILVRDLSPQAALSLASNGLFYGTTTYGSTSGVMVLYSHSIPNTSSSK